MAVFNIDDLFAQFSKMFSLCHMYFKYRVSDPLLWICCQCIALQQAKNKVCIPCSVDCITIPTCTMLIFQGKQKCTCILNECNLKCLAFFYQFSTMYCSILCFHAVIHSMQFNYLQSNLNKFMQILLYCRIQSEEGLSILLQDLMKIFARSSVFQYCNCNMFNFLKANSILITWLLMLEL